MRRREGFTLFEILGAVTILAIVYAWLATSAMQGMRSEGLSKRRLEASLRIDEHLMALETDLAAGIVPPIGRTEEQLDDLYWLLVEVTPFDPSPFLGEEFPPEAATSTLLLPPERPDEAFLRVVDMRLRWEEAGEVFEVRRTTLVQDQAQIAALFPEPGQGLPGEGLGEDAGAGAGDEEPTADEMIEMLQGLAE